MAAALQPRDAADARLLAHVRARGGGAHVEVEALVSGPGIVAALAWLRDEAAAAGEAPLPPDVAAAVDAADAEDAPALVAAAAQRGVPLARAAVDIFLRFYGAFCGTMALALLPTAGLYSAGGILPKLAWRLPCLGGDASDDPLLQAYLDQGPKMAATVRRVPLLLLDDGDAGLKGAAAVAFGLARAGIDGEDADADGGGGGGAEER